MAQQNKEAHYKAVTLFKSEQTATEVSLMQLATEGLPKWRKKYQNLENRLSTIKEKYKARDYTLSELLRTYSHWVSL